MVRSMKKAMVLRAVEVDQHMFEKFDVNCGRVGEVRDKLGCGVSYVDSCAVGDVAEFA